MAIYTTRWFDRWAQKQNLEHANLCKAVREMATGLFEADLGSGLFKKRAARRKAPTAQQIEFSGPGHLPPD